MNKEKLIDYLIEWLDRVLDNLPNKGYDAEVQVETMIEFLEKEKTNED